MFSTILSRRYAPAASVQSFYLTLSGCQLLSQGGLCVRLARHRRRQQVLRRQRCTARRIGGCDKHCDTNSDAQPDRFSRPAWPRRALHSHDHQRAPRKLSVPLTILPRRYAPAASLQSFYLTLSDCKLLSQGRPGVRIARHQAAAESTATTTMHSPAHRRLRQALRHDNDAQPDRFSHGRRGRDVRYARTIANAHHVSQAFMQVSCARLVRIMPPIILPRRYARSPQRKLRFHDRQRASRKLSVHAAALSSPCAHNAPNCTARCHARRPRRTLRSNDSQRASRNLSVHAAALSSPCANRFPHYTAQEKKKRIALPGAGV
jgi:hypothetical protein